ncbi:MAG: GTP-binding protein [Candidatus Micrarchaeaceae archaeon]
MLIQKVTMLGHKDHGKSTLLGMLLIATNSTSQERIAEARRISEELHRQFEPGFILDAFSEERVKGLTIDTTRAELKFKGVGFEFIDVPGHEELINNMLTGASNANVAVLVVSAKPNEGITEQTKRHLFLARMLGISKLVVAINKMDVVSHQIQAYESIKQKLSGYLEKIGFSRRSVSFVPISAYANENLVKRSLRMGWYKGKPLMYHLLSAVTRHNEPYKATPLRILLQGKLDKNTLAGRVISGTLRSGARLRILPSGKTIKARNIFVAGKPRKSATAKESVAIALDRASGNYSGIICEGKNMPKVAKSFVAEVFFVRSIKGKVSIRLNGTKIGAHFKDIKTINISNGEFALRSAKALDAATAKVQLDKPAAFERFDYIKELGRFTIYSGNRFVGIGIIKQ